MTNTTDTAPTLDNKKIHSPAVVQAHRQAVAEFYAARRANEDAQVSKANAETGHANRVLTDAEYFDMAVAADEVRKEKELVRQVAEHAAEQARLDFLASSPAVVQLTAATEFELLTNLQHWLHKKYTINLDNLRYFIRGCYSIELLAPVAGKGGAK